MGNCCSSGVPRTLGVRKGVTTGLRNDKNNGKDSIVTPEFSERTSKGSVMDTGSTTLHEEFSDSISDTRKFPEAGSPHPGLTSHARIIGDPLCVETAGLYNYAVYKGFKVESIWLSDDEVSGLKPPWLFKLSPEGKLPVFEHRDQRFVGSVEEILRYINAKVPSQAVSLFQNSQNISSHIRETIVPLIQKLLLQDSLVVQCRLAPRLQKACLHLESNLLNEHNQEGPYFFGPNISEVDIFLVQTLPYFDLLQEQQGLGIPSEAPLLGLYIDKLHSAPLYQLNLIDQQALRKRYERQAKHVKLSFPGSLFILHHDSISKHLARLTSTSKELATDKPATNETIKKISKDYSRLLEIMQEHAQMEERVLFLVLEAANPGITKHVLLEHSKDLPRMNGTGEEIKMALSLGTDKADYGDVLNALAARLLSLQESTAAHFLEEEDTLLPKLETLLIDEKGSENSSSTVQLVEVMEVSHGRLLPFMLSPLRPKHVVVYLTILQEVLQKDHPSLLALAIQSLKKHSGEFPAPWLHLQRSLPEAAKLADGVQVMAVSSVTSSPSHRTLSHLSARSPVSASRKRSPVVPSISPSPVASKAAETKRILFPFSAQPVAGIAQ